LFPAITVAEPDLLIDRSAEAVTVVDAVDVLLPGTGSVVVEETLAEFDNDPAWAGAVTTTLMVGAVAPVARPARVQDTDTLPELVQVQPVPAADTKVTPAGSVSVTVRLAASEGPALATTREYVRLAPATTVAAAVFVMERFADAVTVVLATEVLLAALGSAVVDEIDDVLDREPACTGAVTVIVIVGAVAPAARVGRVQLTETFPTFVHVHPVPLAETKVTPAGRVSATATFAASDGPMFTATRAYATLPPPTTVAGPVLVNARSADGVTVVLAVDELFAAFGSFVVEATEAPLDRAAPWAGAVTVTVTVGAVVPVASAGRVQLTDTFPVFVQVQPVPVADTKVTPEGRVSVTVKETASEGPAFATTSWYATLPAAATVAGPLFTMERSACATTAVVALDVLFAGFGSGVVAVTAAVLTADPPWAGAVTATVMVGADAPLASEGRVQVTDTLPEFVQVQPVPVADTNVTPAGRVSVTDTLAAAAGPALATARV
jgi:hypothetical protein